MPLARAADGGVAGQIGDGVEREREQHGVKTESSGGQRGLDAGVTCADNGDAGVVVGGDGGGGGDRYGWAHIGAPVRE